MQCLLNHPCSILQQFYFLFRTELLLLLFIIILNSKWFNTYRVTEATHPLHFFILVENTIYISSYVDISRC